MVIVSGGVEGLECLVEVIMYLVISDFMMLVMIGVEFFSVVK